jgi:hypothetical protein
MVNKEKLGEPIGAGAEKKVYQDPENADRVIGVFEEDTRETPNQIKARFYLTKILHLLFPKNIPDMHWAGSEPNSFQADKGEHSELHKIINTGKETHISFEEAMESIESDSAVSDFLKELDKLGIRSMDYASVNYSHDSEGNPLYLDTFYVWKKRNDGKLQLFCDLDKLEDAIDLLSDEDNVRAKSYLSRLKNLYEEESGSK